jgi:predicted ATP-grasp superfamily ATP-dependent carboligase
MKLFIIHARRTGYGVIRSLYKKNTQIYLADTSETAVFSSNKVKKSFIIPDITKTKEKDFISLMINLAVKMDYKTEKPIVFTGKDDYLLFFSKNYDKLSQYFDLSFESNYFILTRALSKIDLIETAKKSNVLIPQSYTNDTPNKVIDENISYPVIVKPAIKTTPEIDVVQKVFRLAKCNNLDELNTATSALSEYNVPYVVQEYIPGNDSQLLTIGTYSYKGKLKGWSTSKKIRQFPPQTGECSLGVTLYDDNLVPLAERLLKELKLTGISQIEFKKYKNKYYLIEINPRIWSWHEINRKVGVNLCELSVNHIKGNTNTFVKSPTKKKVIWHFMLMDYLHNVKLNKNVSIYSFFMSFLRSDIEAFFWIRDIKPFLVHFRQTLKYIKNKYGRV